jgi:hypothetical protein
MDKRIVFDGKRWQLAGSSSSVRVYSVGETIPAFEEGIPAFTEREPNAVTYAEAYEKITGNALRFPVPTGQLRWKE